MPDRKIFILILVGVCIILLTHFRRSQHIDVDYNVSQNQAERLACEGSELVLRKTNTEQGTGCRLDEIPPRLGPLFFAPIPLNRADRELLETISGIGPVLAGQILEKRKELGEFTCSEDLLQVRGVGEKKAALLVQHGTF